LTRSQARFQHLANLLVGVTGIVYAWMRYVSVPADPYAVVNHPLQPFFQHSHVLSAPLLIFACGWIWSDHVWQRVRTRFRVRRPTGLALFCLFVPMGASGYLLQTSSSPLWRTVWIWAHVATSLMWIAAYLAHQLSRRGYSANSVP
jgi:hypothetical protein